MSKKVIFELVDQLPTNNLTIRALKTLDRVIPGEWENTVGFDNTIRVVTGESDPALIQAIGERAVVLFNDKSQGYQNALWLYQKVDEADKALGTAILANKLSDKVPLMGWVSRLTPRAQKAQTIDLSIKLVVELVAFCQINGIPGDSIGDFVQSLSDYSGESLMRLTALICFDGLIPLGPHFLSSVTETLTNLPPKELTANPVFNRVQNLIPGQNPASKLAFMGESFEATQGWISDFTRDRALTPEKVADNLKTFIDFTEDKLDYLGALLDVSTNYYEHTGIQTLARRLIERAFAET
ncbi:MAG: hypothetical protein AAGG02_01480 [Cyanobacteria bacterium P01_H01_bin.15]